MRKIKIHFIISSRLARNNKKRPTLEGLHYKVNYFNVDKMVKKLLENENKITGSDLTAGGIKNEKN